MNLLLLSVIFLIKSVDSFLVSHGRAHKRSFNLIRIRNVNKVDDMGYLVKDRSWFEGLSQDAGARYN